MNETNQAHTPLDGFIDIKPLPEFHPQTKSTGWEAFIYIALAIIILIFLKKLFAKKGVFISTPYSKVTAKLNSLTKDYNSGKITLKKLSSEYSLALREYLGGKYKFKAQELTRNEIVSKLRTSIEQVKLQTEALNAKNLNKPEPNSNLDQNMLVDQTKSILNTLDYISFSNKEVSEYNADNLKTEIQQVIEFMEGSN